MSRASLVYVAMFIILIAGMWAILRAGSRLAAPADLEGEWNLAWDAASSGRPAKLTVQQSGVFTSVSCAGGPPLSGRLSKPRGSPRVSGDLTSHDGRWRMSLAPYAGGDEFTGTLDGPGPAGPFTAYRTSARPKSTAPATKPKPGTPHARQ